MSFRNTLFSLLFILLAVPSLAHAENVRFLRLIDGDSILVEYHGYSQEVRLIGIDAPEWGQEYGTQAKAHAMNFCFGYSLRLEFDKDRKDRYGRLLAYVYCGDKMLNAEMVRAGLAIAVKIKPNVKYSARLKKIEDKARAERRGFWLRGGLKMTPSQWRKKSGKYCFNSGNEEGDRLYGLSPFGVRGRLRLGLRPISPDTFSSRPAPGL